LRKTKKSVNVAADRKIGNLARRHATLRSDARGRAMSYLDRRVTRCHLYDRLRENPHDAFPP